MTGHVRLVCNAPAHSHLVRGDGGDDGVWDVVNVGGVVDHLDVGDVGGAIRRGRGQILLAVVGRPEAVPAVTSRVGCEEHGGGGAHGLAQCLGITLCDRHRLSGILHLTSLICHLWGWGGGGGGGDIRLLCTTEMNGGRCSPGVVGVHA